MSGFFYDIRSFFSANFSGRYLSLLLRELARREPKVFAEVFRLPKHVSRDLVRGDLQVEREVRFKVGAKARLADLVLLKAGKPIVFFEVKEDDIGNAGNASQLHDYLSAIDRVDDTERKRFIHLSRFLPSVLERSILRKAKADGLSVDDIRYRDLHAKLAGKPEFSLSNILHQYLEDIGVASYATIDLDEKIQGRQVAFMLIQMLGFPHSHSLGRLQSDSAMDAVPELMKTLNANVELLGEWVRSANPKLFRQRFTRKFRPWPHFDLRSLNRALEKEALDDGISKLLPGDGKHVKSGAVTFSAHGKFALSKTASRNGMRWLYVEVGYELFINRDARSEEDALVEMYVYASIWWNGSGSKSPYRSSKQSKFPSEQKAMSSLSTCLRQVRDKALATAPIEYRPALTAFVLPEKGGAVSIL